MWLNALCSPAREGDGKNSALEKIHLVYQQAKQALVLTRPLYFQFADKAISLYTLHQKFSSTSNIRYQVFREDFLREIWDLEASFHTG